METFSAAARWARSTAAPELVAARNMPSSSSGRLADDPQLIARFLQEQERAVRSRSREPRPHPDLVVEGGSAAIVMDLVEGTDLRDLASVGDPAAKQTVQITAQLLDGLAAVHAANIVHRDVKPENILVDTYRACEADRLRHSRFADGETLARTHRAYRHT